jgi:hypothetical protein
MAIKAAVNLSQEGAFLRYAGRGYQPNCDYPSGSVIGEEITPASDNALQVKTPDGKVLFVRHEDYAIVDD